MQRLRPLGLDSGGLRRLRNSGRCRQRCRPRNGLRQRRHGGRVLRQLLRLRALYSSQQHPCDQQRIAQHSRQCASEAAVTICRALELSQCFPLVTFSHVAAGIASYGFGKLLFSRLFPVITSTTYGDGGGGTYFVAVGRFGAGAPPENKESCRTDAGISNLVSTVLRSDNWIFPSVLAMVSLAASSGVTNSVTTGTFCGFPSRSCSIFCPAASTFTFSRIVRVMFCSPWPESATLPVTSTSTIVPGITKPATPTTSFTATESARIPSGIVAGKPAPDCISASLLSSIGSFSANGVITARFAQSAIRVNIPATGSPDGQGISRRLLASTRVPTCNGCAATTICSVVMGLMALALWKARYTNVLRNSATTIAIPRPMSIRLRFINSSPLPQLQIAQRAAQ